MSADLALTWAFALLVDWHRPVVVNFDELEPSNAYACAQPQLCAAPTGKLTRTTQFSRVTVFRVEVSILQWNHTVTLPLSYQD